MYYIAFVLKLAPERQVKSNSEVNKIQPAMKDQRTSESTSTTNSQTTPNVYCSSSETQPENQNKRFCNTWKGFFSLEASLGWHHRPTAAKPVIQVSTTTTFCKTVLPLTSISCCSPSSYLKKAPYMKSKCTAETNKR